MKYLNVTCSTVSTVTGVNNGDAQVETLNKKNEYSFANKNEEEYFTEFCREIWKKSKGIFINNFIAINNYKISSITYFPTKKRVKEIDVLTHCTQSAFNIFDFLISDKALKIIFEFNLSHFNSIPAQVKGFVTQYYLIGFPIIPYSEFNFKDSVFRNDITGDKISFQDYDEFKNYNTICISPQKIILKQQYKYDILRTPVGLFFSEPLINKIKENHIIGLEVKDVILEYNNIIN